MESKNYKLTFGKFKGRTLEKIPLKYLDWLVGRAIFPDTKSNIENYLVNPVIAKELERQLDK